MEIPHPEGITTQQWKAIDHYFNGEPRRFFYGVSPQFCIESFTEINVLRKEDPRKAQEREERMYRILCVSS